MTAAPAMTYLGTRGRTADEMAATPHFTSPPADLHNDLGSLVKELNARGCMFERDAPSFRAGHPFIYMMRHRKSGAILFMGCLKIPPSRKSDSL